MNYYDQKAIKIGRLKKLKSHSFSELPNFGVQSGLKKSKKRAKIITIS